MTGAGGLDGTQEVGETLIVYKGAQRAQVIARETLNEVKQKMGLI